ncbi:MAG: hypothetical protein HY738_05570, partial [Bacteroidia bacterium]|nr:hypothetical protein [Bacteroidia bacterium]
NSGKITNDVKDAINALKTGDKVFFKEIVALGPDGRSRNMGTISFEIVGAKSKIGTINDLMMLLNEYSQNNDWDNYSIAAIHNEKLFSFDETILNNISWNFNLHIDNKKNLEFALKWSKKSIDLYNDWTNNDTYACLLYKIGKYSEADQYEQKAIKIAKNKHIDNQTIQEMEEMLQKIKKSSPQK